MTGAGPSPRDRRLYTKTLGSLPCSPQRPWNPAVTGWDQARGHHAPLCTQSLALRGTERIQEAAVVRNPNERPCPGPGVGLRTHS